jgi:hypothetical protein
VARFFTLTKQQLLTFRLIAWLYHTISYWLSWAHERIIETTVYRWAKRLKTRVKAMMAAWFKKN